MFGLFKKKNYLKRADFISTVDSDKIWSKTMNLPEIESVLEQLESELLKYDFDKDKNFIMNTRRKALKTIIEEQVQKRNNNISEIGPECLFIFWEFVGDENPGNSLSTCEEYDLTREEFDLMDKTYRENGIICSQEKDNILEMIKLLKNYINGMSN